MRRVRCGTVSGTVALKGDWQETLDCGGHTERQRGKLLEELHQARQWIDRMDLLIRSAEQGEWSEPV